MPRDVRKAEMREVTSKILSEGEVTRRCREVQGGGKVVGERENGLVSPRCSSPLPPPLPSLPPVPSRTSLPTSIPCKPPAWLQPPTAMSTGTA